MPARHTIITLLSIFALLAHSAFGITNQWCPVEPDKKTKERHSLEYRGTTIHFCCASCIDDFLVSPESYLSLLPENMRKKIGESSSSEALHSFTEATDGSDELLMLEIQKNENEQILARHTITFFSGVSITLILGLWFFKKSFPKKTFIITAITATAATYFIILVSKNSTQAEELKALRKKIDDQLIMKSLHYASYYEFGNPLKTPNDKSENSLSVIYYRGNDERSPELFNNGFYRTCTFHIALEDASGNLVKIGDNTTDKKLFLALKIERAPHTPDHFFSKKLMSKMYLTKSSLPRYAKNLPPQDRTGLTTTEEDQVFSARYPLQELKAGTTLEDIIYLREERLHKEKPLGSRVHYAIQSNIHLDANGVIQGNSNLWMGATYRTRRLRNWEIPTNEWLGLTPIPNLPEAHKDVDNKTLGITEQEKGEPAMP